MVIIILRLCFRITCDIGKVRSNKLNFHVFACLAFFEPIWRQHRQSGVNERRDPVETSTGDRPAVLDGFQFDRVTVPL